MVVTDNGLAMKSVAVARWFAGRPHLSHVRTRHRAPHTNGVVERWFESLKYALRTQLQITRKKVLTSALKYLVRATLYCWLCWSGLSSIEFSNHSSNERTGTAPREPGRIGSKWTSRYTGR